MGDGFAGRSVLTYQSELRHDSAAFKSNVRLHRLGCASFPLSIRAHPRPPQAANSVRDPDP